MVIIDNMQSVNQSITDFEFQVKTPILSTNKFNIGKQTKIAEKEAAKQAKIAEKAKLLLLCRDWTWKSGNLEIQRFGIPKNFKTIEISN